MVVYLRGVILRQITKSASDKKKSPAGEINRFPRGSLKRFNTFYPNKRLGVVQRPSQFACSSFTITCHRAKSACSCRATHVMWHAHPCHACHLCVTHLDMHSWACQTCQPCFILDQELFGGYLILPSVNVGEILAESPAGMKCMLLMLSEQWMGLT